MKHHILVKWNELVTDKERTAGEVAELFRSAGEKEGVRAVRVLPNCVDRPNRYDLMIVLEMEKESLPVWDGSELHKKWKETYGPLTLSKAIFDSEE